MALVSAAVYVLVTAFLGTFTWACFRGALMLSGGRRGVQALLTLIGSMTGLAFLAAVLTPLVAFGHPVFDLFGRWAR